MTTRPDTTLPPEPEVSSGSLSIEIIEREQAQPVIDREELALRVIGHVDAINVKLAELKPDIERLWLEFENLPDGETIAGCYTKAEFCEKRLRRTPRAVRYMLAGGNHRGENVSPNALPTESEGVRIPHDGADTPLYTSTGLLIAPAYSRVIFLKPEDRARHGGPYVEFAEVEETNLRPGCQCRVPANHKYFDEYRTMDAANVMVYHQQRPVGYADYRIGLWYVSLADLFTSDGQPVVAVEPEPEAAEAAAASLPEYAASLRIPCSVTAKDGRVALTLEDITEPEARSLLDHLAQLQCRRSSAAAAWNDGRETRYV